MKKILLIILLFAGLITKAQYPNTITGGNSSTLNKQLGGYGASLGFVFTSYFSDTTAANLLFIKNVPGHVIRVVNDLWMRNTTADTWVKISGGTTPTLQQVTDIGSNTTRIIRSDTAFRVTTSGIDFVSMNKVDVGGGNVGGGFLIKAATSGNSGVLYANTLTSSRSWTLPDDNGTIALLSDIISGTDNTNLGSFYRLLVPSSQGIKGIAPGYGTLWDSTTNANSLTSTVDTSVIATQYDISGFLSSIPTLQQVTTAGNSITNPIYSEADVGFDVVSTLGGGSVRANIGKFSDNGFLTLGNTIGYSGTIKPNILSGFHNYLLPETGHSTDTLATLFDVRVGGGGTTISFPYTTSKYLTGYNTFGSLTDSVRAALSAGINILFSGGVISADTTTGSTKLATQGDIDRGIAASVPTLQQVLTAGSTLTTNNTIGFGANTLNFTTSNNSQAFNVTNSDANGYAITGNALNGAGVTGSATTGSGVQGTATDGDAGNFFKNTSTNNAVTRSVLITGGTSGTPANGLGTSIDFDLETSTSFRNAARLIARWTDVTDATRTAQVDLKATNSATSETYANFQTGGIVRVNNLADTLATKAYARSVGGAGGGYTNLTQFVAQTNHRLFYSDGSGGVQELAFGSSGQYLKSTGTTSAPTWDTPSGSGTINSGTTGKPAYYTGSTTLDDFAAVDYATSGTNVLITTQNTTDVGLNIKGVSSQTADLQNWSSSSGTGDLGKLTKDGYFQSVRGGFGTDPSYTLHVASTDLIGAYFTSSHALANRVGINHASNSGFGLYIADVLKWSVAIADPIAGSNPDFGVFNDAASAYAMLIDGSNNNIKIGGLATPAEKLDVAGNIKTSGYINLAEIAAPSTPASATSVLYVKSDGLFYGKDDAGVETMLSNSGGSSTFAGLTDVNLTSITTNDFLKWDGTDWINRSPSQVRTDLSLVIGTNVQAWDTDLDALAGMANGIAARTGAGTYSPRTITGTALMITVTNGDGVSGNPTLSLPATLALTGSSSAPNEIRLAEDTDNGTEYVALNVPSSLVGNRIATFPDANTAIPIYTQTITYTGPSTARTVTYPDANFTAARIDAAQTFVGSQTFASEIITNTAVTASGNAATVAVTASLTTVTNNSAATLTITMTTASAVDGQISTVRVLDFSAAAQTITWVNTENSSIAAPTTSNGSTTLFLTVRFIYNSATSKWRCIGYA